MQRLERDLGGQFFNKFLKYFHKKSLNKIVIWFKLYINIYFQLPDFFIKNKKRVLIQIWIPAPHSIKTESPRINWQRQNVQKLNCFSQLKARRGGNIFFCVVAPRQKTKDQKAQKNDTRVSRHTKSTQRNKKNTKVFGINKRIRAIMAVESAFCIRQAPYKLGKLWQSQEIFLF